MSNDVDVRHAYLYARILLGVSVTLSLACNAAHAYLNAERVQVLLAMGVGAIPPLILALSVEAVVFCSRHARLAWGWGAVLFAAAAGLVTGFSMSFAAISDLGRMANMSWWTAPMLPVGIDALVITGLGMVALFRPRAIADQAQEPAHAAHQSGAQVLTTAPEAVPTDAPAVQPVATQLSTGDAHGQHVGARVLDTSSAAQGAVQHPAHGQATPAVQVPATSGDDADGPAQQVQEGHGESAQVFTLRHRPDVQSGAATEQAASLLDTPTGAAQDAGAQLVIDPVQEAAVLRERGDSRMPEEQLLAVLRGIAAGDAHAAISRATGASRTTIKRLAELVPTEPDESDSEVSGPEGRRV